MQIGTKQVRLAPAVLYHERKEYDTLRESSGKSQESDAMICSLTLAHTD